MSLTSPCTRHGRQFLALAIILGIFCSAGCSLVVDGELRDRADGGGIDGGGADAGTLVSCEQAADGTECGGSRICVGEVCMESRCGDGYPDLALEEECDDGNAEAGDGCNPDCRYSCDGAEDCDDNRACNGVSTCDLTTHRCVPGTNLDDGTECVDLSAGIEAGQCRTGVCVAPGCGNGVLSGTEECDDGNTEDDDGCDNDCTFSCESDDECQNETVCDGVETCDVGTHTCRPGTVPDCEDTENVTNSRGTWGPECTVDTCDPLMGCVHTLRDRDGDGFPPASYMIDDTTYSCLGTAANDCNDIDNMVYPGAEEICDGRDNNCVGGIDETAPTWFADCDGDGFAVTTAPTFVGCNAASAATGCPNAATARWTTTRPTAGNRATYDCNDSNPNVRPTQTTYSTAIPAPGSGYDWNCNGTWEQEAPNPAPCTGTFCVRILCQDYRGSCFGDYGWGDGSAPSCGNSETFGYCERLGDGTCGRRDRSRTQRCR